MPREDLVGFEEGYYDQFDRQEDFVKRFGKRYLALQSFEGGGRAEPAP